MPEVYYFLLSSELREFRAQILEAICIFHTDVQAPVPARIEPLSNALTRARETSRTVLCFGGLTKDRPVGRLSLSVWKAINMPFLAVFDTARTSSTSVDDTDGPRRLTMSGTEHSWAIGLRHLTARMQREMEEETLVPPCFSIGIPMYKDEALHPKLFQRGVTMSPVPEMMHELQFPFVVYKAAIDLPNVPLIETKISVPATLALALQRNLVSISPLKNHSFEPAVLVLVSVGPKWRISLAYISKDDGTDWETTVKTIFDVSIETEEGQAALVEKLENASEWLYGPHRAGIVAHLNAIENAPA